MEHRDDTGSWLYRMVLAAWIGFILFLAAYAVALVLHESYHESYHKFTHPPDIVACPRGDAVSVEITPNRVHGRMETFDLANCTFYWWESNRGGD